jgi:hypothetical protein
MKRPRLVDSARCWQAPEAWEQVVLDRRLWRCRLDCHTLHLSLAGTDCVLPRAAGLLVRVAERAMEEE